MLSLSTSGQCLLWGRPICEPGPSLLLLCQLIIGTCPEATDACWEREGRVGGVGTTSIWATSSLNILGPSHKYTTPLAVVLLCVPQLHGLMGQTHPFVVGSSGCMVPWRPMVKHPASAEGQQQAESCSPKRSSDLQRWQGFTPKSQGPVLRFTGRGCQRLQTASFLHQHLWGHRVCWALRPSDHTVCTAGTCCRACPCSGRPLHRSP